MKSKNLSHVKLPLAGVCQKSPPSDQAVAPGSAPPPTARPLRLEWIEAGSLTENPLNWKRHSEEHLQTVRDLLADPEIGWAGACLFNEETGRLIDGHARKKVSDPKTPVPVLVGSWSEEAEKKILATLDPVAMMAKGDSEAYAALVASVTADSLWVRDLLHNTQATLNNEPQADEKDPAADPASPLNQLELHPFEHYDYIMLLFKNDQDFQHACERLGIERVQVKYPGGLTKVGLGRVIDGAKFLRMCQPAMPVGEAKGVAR